MIMIFLIFFQWRKDSTNCSEAKKKPQWLYIGKNTQRKNLDSTVPTSCGKEYKNHDRPQQWSKFQQQKKVWLSILRFMLETLLILTQEYALCEHACWRINIVQSISLHYCETLIY